MVKLMQLIQPKKIDYTESGSIKLTILKFIWTFIYIFLLKAEWQLLKRSPQNYKLIIAYILVNYTMTLMAHTVYRYLH